MQARPTTETTSATTYGSNGYRSDCRTTPFQEVLAVNHDTGAQAWFKQATASPRNFTIGAANYSAGTTPYGLWTGFGSATWSNRYQFGICDSTTSLSPGLFFSGDTRLNNAVCTKMCNAWCGDTSSPYFRLNAGSGYTGVSFGENGARDLGSKTVSYGIRVWTPPPTQATSCAEVLAQNPTASSGMYWINPIGGVNTAYRAYCEYVFP